MFNCLTAVYKQYANIQSNQRVCKFASMEASSTCMDAQMPVIDELLAPALSTTCRLKSLNQQTV